ncbi:MAG: beta-galactosidase trimerization domain-containing protein [Acidobacteria bacterium]|nr:beta-galactosidase trimerization domain-containing protein [Acidobacteriota bacterium]
MNANKIFLFICVCSHLFAADTWWEREPLRIIDLVTPFGQITALPPADAAARKVAGFYNAEHLHVMGMGGGLDDQRFFFSTKLAAKSNEDYLGRYLPEARRRGLRVFIYFNVHWYTAAFGNAHPDWLQVREDSRPLTGVYQTGMDFCVNSPWREWVFQLLRDLSAYPIDGIFFDGPIFFPDTCYCRWCRQKFEKAHGRPLPSKKDRQGKPFHDLVEFQAASLAEFLRDSRRVIKSANAAIAFYMNGGTRGGNWATGRMNRALVGEQDLLGSEGGFLYGDLTRSPIWKPGATAKLLEAQAGGKPRIIFSAAAHKPWTFSLLPAPELRLLYAESIANASGVWFGITPDEFQQPEMQALVEMNRFLAKNAEYYRDTKSEARVAPVWSDTTANTYAGAAAQLIDIDRVPQRSEVGNLDQEFGGLYDALLRAQVPFDVIDDYSLEREDLARYAALLLPNVACMSDQTAARLRDYVRQGGHLFATFETSLYDEFGVRRQDFALRDLFGVTATGKIAGPQRWDFLKRRGSSPLLDGLAREWIPSPVYHVQVKPSGASPLLQFTRPLTGPYDGIPDLSDDPALLVNGNTVYSAGDLGNAIQSFHMMEALRLVANAVREVAPSPVTIENAPQSVEVVLRSQNGGRRLLLHLINYTGEMTRPIQRVLPLKNLRISVRISAPVKRAHTLVRPQRLSVKAVRDQVQLTLPQLLEYEVVVLDF